ncbi:hypothetical protein TcBrA4_0043070 [Trypanosoma cruzi]|nr:hypothetical protein TcBrA4_0043070 [Trypanosoma cruzi]
MSRLSRTPCYSLHFPLLPFFLLLSLTGLIPVHATHTVTLPVRSITAPTPLPRTYSYEMSVTQTQVTPSGSLSQPNNSRSLSSRSIPNNPSISTNVSTTMTPEHSVSVSESSHPQITPVHVTALDLETNLKTYSKLIETISELTWISHSTIMVVSYDLSLQFADDDSDEIDGEEGVYRRVTLGFGKREDASTTKHALLKESIPNVRLYTRTKTDETGGLTKTQKVILGCALGIGLPLILAIVGATYFLIRYHSHADKEVGDLRTGKKGNTVIDLDYNAVRMAPVNTTAPTVPIKQKNSSKPLEDIL